MAVNVTPDATFANAAVSDQGFGFEHNGVKYLITAQAESDPGVVGNLHAQYSTDGGNTWIDVLGPARPFNLGAFLNVGFPWNYSVGVDGDTAIVAMINATKNNASPITWENFTISQVTLDLSVTPPVWGSLTTSAPVSFVGLMEYTSQATQHTNRVTLHLIVRGANDYIIFCSGVTAGSGTTQKGRCSYVTWDGTTFGAEVQLPAQAAANYYLPIGACFAPVSGRMHFLYTEQVFPDGNPNILHVAMESDGTFGTPSTVIPNFPLAGSLFSLGSQNAPSWVSAPLVYDTPSEHIGFLTAINDGSNNCVVTFFNGTEAFNPTFAGSTITSNQAEVPLGQLFFFLPQLFSVTSNGNSILATWAQNNGGPSFADSAFYYSKSDTQPLSWSAPVALIPVTLGPSELVANQVIGFPITEGYGVFGVANSDPFTSPFFFSQFGVVEDTAALTLTFTPPAFVASGGTPPYVHYEIISGGLPPGMTLNPTTGIIEGSSNIPGTYDFTAEVIDSVDDTATAPGSLTIGGVLPPSPLSPAAGGPYVIPIACPCDLNELAAEALLRMRYRKREWPYLWYKPSPSAIRVTAQDVIPVPAVIAGQQQGISYTVDQGFMFALQALVVEFLADAVPGVANPGEFTWSLDLNRPLGLLPFQGSPIQGFQNVDVPLGTIQIPWPLECPEIFSPNDCIRAKFTNIGLAAVGAPNYFKTILLGWRWPVG